MTASLSLEAALAHLSGPRQDLDSIRGIATVLQGVVGRCRERLQAGYSVSAAPEGFAAALRRFSASIARERGVKVHVHLATNVAEQLTARSAYHLHHIAVEAIVGAIRHSRGSMVTVSISGDPESIVLRVEDDGVGASVDWAREKQVFHEAEAVTHMLRGDLSLRPRRPGGLSIEFRLPNGAAGGSPRGEHLEAGQGSGRAQEDGAAAVDPRPGPSARLRRARSHEERPHP
jgi:nitrate/nitrite-specific signal transduction histidine kinase